MGKFCVLLCVIGLLGGCLSGEARYQRNMRGWVGRTPEELVTQWGSPTQVITNGDTEYFIYRIQKEAPLPNTSAFSTPTNPPILLPINETTRYQETFFCETTFVVQNDRITDWSFEGDACRAD